MTKLSLLLLAAVSPVAFMAATIKVRRDDHPDGEVLIDLGDYDPETMTLADGEELPADYKPGMKRETVTDKGGDPGVDGHSVPEHRVGEQYPMPGTAGQAAPIAPSTPDFLRPPGNEAPPVPTPVSPANTTPDATQPPSPDAPPPAPPQLSSEPNQFLQKVGRNWVVTYKDGSKWAGQPDNGFKTQADAQAWAMQQPPAAPAPAVPPSPGNNVGAPPPPAGAPAAPAPDGTTPPAAPGDGLTVPPKPAT